jgi:putative flippase GtrA
MRYSLSSLFKNKLLRFGVVGLIGFFIEASLLSYFATQPDIGPIYGRCISFPVAVFTTWILNRKMTFQSSNSPGAESLKYLVVQTFYVLVSSWKYLAKEPVLPLFLAATLGFAVNFLLSKKLVFK